MHINLSLFAFLSTALDEIIREHFFSNFDCRTFELWHFFSILHFIWILLIFRFLVNALLNRMMTSLYKIKIHNLSLFCPTFILYGFCLYFNFSSMPSLIGWWQVLMNQKWDLSKSYARTPRRLGCTTQSTWNYLCFIWLLPVFQFFVYALPIRIWPAPILFFRLLWFAAQWRSTSCHSRKTVAFPL